MYRVSFTCLVHGEIYFPYLPHKMLDVCNVKCVSSYCAEQRVYLQNRKMCINQSEHNYISNKWHMEYLQYQLHVPASVLAIVRLYSSYQVTIQYACCTGGEILFTVLGGMIFEIMARITNA
jgi:hypothetical protein